MTAPLHLGIAGLNGYGSTYFRTLAGREDAATPAYVVTHVLKAGYLSADTGREIILP